MATAFIGLGSNIGDREKNLMEALQLLARLPGIDIRRVSSFYETEPVGYLDQPDFLNAAVELDTALPPLALLAETKSIEQKLWRQPGVRWGPRTIDLDLLLYDDQELADEKLRLPHPEMSRRAFVLVPLAEIAGDKRLPDGRTIRDMLHALGKISGVKLYRNPPSRKSYAGPGQRRSVKGA